MNLREKLDVKLATTILLLLLTFVIYSSVIKAYFGLATPDYQEILGDRYFLYMILNAFGLFIFCLIPFILGLRYHIYRVRKEIDFIISPQVEEVINYEVEVLAEKT